MICVHLFVTSLALLQSATASIVNLQIYADRDGEAQAQSTYDAQQQLSYQSDISVKAGPGWHLRDDRHLVPLIPEARTGLLSPEVEEGLIYAVGPRFANEFISVSLEASRGDVSGQASCDLSCAGVVIKAMPCLTAAIKCKCLEPIKNCPVRPNAFCKCVSCLPQKIQDFLNKLGVCKNPELLALDAPQSSSLYGAEDYASYISVSRQDPTLLGFRGDLSESTIEEAKAAGICIGTVCDNGSCCFGLCLPGSICIGQNLKDANENGQTRHIDL